MAKRLFLISGSSGSGKTTLLNQLGSIPSLPFKVIQKASTRPPRQEESDEIRCVSSVDRAKYDIQYEQYHVWYGLNSAEIWECLQEGKYAFAIVNDIRAIEELKSSFGSLALSCFIYRKVTPRRLAALIRRRAKPGVREGELHKEQRKRIGKLPVVFDKFIENIEVFDHVILNVSSRNRLLQQMLSIIGHYETADEDASVWRSSNV